MPDPLASPTRRPVPRLWRSRHDRVFTGVLGGFCEKYDLEPRPVRILYSITTLVTGGLAALPYLYVWAITGTVEPRRPGPRFWRSVTNKVFSGVLGGIAEKLALPTSVVRPAYVALTFVTGFVPGILTYLILWAVTRPYEAEPPRDFWTG